jgi:hypothetical protein
MDMASRSSLEEGPEQPTDDNVVHDPERSVLPMPPINHGFTDPKRDGKDQGKMSGTGK